MMLSGKKKSRDEIRGGKGSGNREGNYLIEADHESGGKGDWAKRGHVECRLKRHRGSMCADIAQYLQKQRG